MNINTPRDWVGAKNMFMFSFGHSLLGRKTHKENPPRSRDNPVKSMFMCCFFVCFFAPKLVKNPKALKPENTKNLRTTYKIPTQGWAPARKRIKISKNYNSGPKMTILVFFFGISLILSLLSFFLLVFRIFSTQPGWGIFFVYFSYFWVSLGIANGGVPGRGFSNS